MPYSKALYARTREYLDAKHLHYTENDELGRFDFGFVIPSKTWVVRVCIFVGTDSLIVVSVPQFGGDPSDAKAMRALSEYVLRANYGLVQGSFQLDLDDGELRYWSALLFDGDDLPSTHTIERVLSVAVLMWKRYGDDCLKVIRDGMDPKEAVREAEQPNTTPSTVPSSEA